MELQFFIPLGFQLFKLLELLCIKELVDKHILFSEFQLFSLQFWAQMELLLLLL